MQVFHAFRKEFLAKMAKDGLRLAKMRDGQDIGSPLGKLWCHLLNYSQLCLNSERIVVYRLVLQDRLFLLALLGDHILHHH